MANNYTEFSEELCDLTPEEAAWLKHQLQVVHVYDGEEYPDDAELPERLRGEDPDWSGCRAYRDMISDGDELEHCETAGFSYKFEDAALWLYAEEWANLEHVAHFVQKFLKQFRPGDYWSLTYAATCSKPRVGEFGGGAMFVTANNIVWEDTYTFVEEQEKVVKLMQDSLQMVTAAVQAQRIPDDLYEQAQRLASRMVSLLDRTSTADHLDWRSSPQALAEIQHHLTLWVREAVLRGTVPPRAQRPAG